ncbi:hypothetical protein [Legionella londiniensis]|uniref:Uncharacterized protein n=1 Tax=Legionella londiniensis TaxID=45068 RepID=A0A0W0VP24_9GAMM|nr:hypothetical protein [Legionella londiniensis]KTD21811.1 hypothetical protein Llon_0976 [Legionella londiniensis]STX92706.1 Uncharacterised protein [Legionella londiniensis]
MKLIKNSSALHDLNGFIEKKLAELIKEEKIREQKERNNLGSKDKLTIGQESFKKNRAATAIQRLWRKRKIKQAFVKSPYETYLSLIEPQDEQRLLSSIMFGRHVAELQGASEQRIQNPYIHKKAFYHRDDNLSGALLEKLLSEFKISQLQKDENILIPVTLLKNTPVEEIAKNFFPKSGMTKEPKLIKDNEHAIGIIAIPRNNPNKNHIVRILRASGLIASPWEIAVNIKKNKDNISPIKTTKLDENLPKTTEELFKSNIIHKLSRIAENKRYPTQKIAKSLVKILKKMPKNLKPAAVQRISCMVDMANTFYEYDYPKFAFAVYAILHEVSLSLLEQNNKEGLNQGFDAFLEESQDTMLQSSGLDPKKLDKTSFIACPTMSGTNAYALAMKLALKMTKTSGNPPPVKVLKPSYFEFDYITKTTNKSDADIFVLSGGPIVNPEGLTPGVDINQFIKRNVIDKKRTKPTTLIIDATTTLYKNLALDEEVKELIYQGKLSIIIHESHQKFGMIHADQAQYGRMFALCSKEQFGSEIIDEMQSNAKEDYSKHLDLRIGAYISTSCGKVLEEIKQQHFTNGALLRNILIQASLASSKIVKHEDMLSNLEELYFVTSSHKELKEASKGIIEARDSFGHFGTVKARVADQFRLSPDASDDIDCLIQTAQIYLAHYFKPNHALELLVQNTKKSEKLSISEQIIAAALANNIINIVKVVNPSKSIPLMFALGNLMEHCDSLKGRQYYNKITKNYFELRQRIIQKYDVKNPKYFFTLTQILYNKNIELEDRHLKILSSNAVVSKIILENHEDLSNDAIVAILNLANDSLTDKQAKMMANNKKFCASIVKMHNAVEEIFLSLDNAPDKYQKAKYFSKKYFATSFKALENFHDEASKLAGDKNKLIDELNQAKDVYCKDVLGKDRSTGSKAMRYILKAAVNFIAALTFGVAHYINYKKTGQAVFFSGTNSQNRLRNLHKKLIEEYKDECQESKPSNSKNV